MVEKNDTRKKKITFGKKATEQKRKGKRKGRCTM